MGKIKVGVVGVGGMGGGHVKAWKTIEGAELVAICDILPKKHDKERYYDNLDAMLDNEKLDILDVCTPTYLHKEHSLKGIERGLHVFSEKPVALFPKDVTEIYDTAERKNVKFMVGQVLRFWTEYIYLKDVFDTKKYGSLQNGTMWRMGGIPGWSWENWMHDEDKSGLAAFDMHVHDVDFMYYLLGKPNAVVSSRVKEGVVYPRHDYICTKYMYDDFFINCESAWHSANIRFGAGFRFYFEEAVLDYTKGELLIYENDECEPVVVEPDKVIGSTGINVNTTDAYANELRHFLDCVANNKPVEIMNREQVYGVLSLIHKELESAETGQIVRV
ncbi:MAG: Gfo/Idh/MocA family oxidoreductase [Oscillospiraceae bacterium]|nr:Gfo/Idh/MocA family oxidoreductase [Oscillospiraceae bacterium]